MPAALPIRGDRSPAELRRLARHEHDGRVSARLVALANALEGIPREEAARLAGMTGQTLGDWVHRYNAQDVAGLRDRHRAGRHCRLDPGQQAALKAIILRGPDPKRHGCIAWRARDLCRLVEQRFQIRYSESGMLRLLHSLELSWQKPRPVHPEASTKAQARFKKPAWADAGRGRTSSRGRDGRAVVRDEARVGQKGRVTQVWWQRGLRPRAVRDHRFTSAQLFGAVCPERGVGVALVLPEADTVAMNLLLAELSQALPTRTHAVLVLDRAGWHVSGALQIPGNITLVHLPSHAPELNPVEKVWQYLRDRWLSHLVLPDYRAVLDAACDAWSALCAEPGRLRSLTSFPWLPASVDNS